MSVCFNCSLVARMDLGGEVVVYSPQSYLIHRVHQAIPEATGHFHTTVTLAIDSFRRFIQDLPEKINLTLAEREHLHVAHIAPTEQYGPDLLGKTRPLSQWLHLVDDSPLLKVLKNETLAVHFQPIFDIASKSIFGYECLSRGIDAQQKVVPPVALINEARETDLIFNLDRLMREKCLHAAHDADIDSHIFINFVPTAVYNPEFCLRSTVAWVEKLKLDPAKIVFEVVETEKIGDSAHLLKILNFYRDTGFKIALDDVAAGYSGLLQLLTIRPDIMKIDREVVDGIHENPDKQTIFRAMMNVAQDYGITTLAEGIEQQAELDFLRENKVSLAQGYLLGKPQASTIA